jgi:hypothetical protein
MSATSAVMDISSIKLDEEAINIIQEATSIVEENTRDKIPDLPLSKDKFVYSSTIADPL